MSTELTIDWGGLYPLRLHASLLAEELFAGRHRSRRRGAGIEFGGHRPYVPGDDLRFLDRRSLLRHDRLMVRQFETETERALFLCVDGSASMAFCGERALGSKFAYASLLASAMCRIAVAGQDPVGLSFLDAAGTSPVREASGLGAFERVCARLEAVRATASLVDDAHAIERGIAGLAHRARAGSVIMVFSDLVDLPSSVINSVASLASAPRALVVVQVLDPDEQDLGFSGTLRLRAMEGEHLVETNADTVRDEYLRDLAKHNEAWSEAVVRRGGRVVQVTTNEPAIDAVRQMVRAVGQVRR